MHMGKAILGNLFTLELILLSLLSCNSSTLFSFSPAPLSFLSLNPLTLTPVPFNLLFHLHISAGKD